MKESELYITDGIDLNNLNDEWNQSAVSVIPFLNTCSRPFS